MLEELQIHLVGGRDGVGDKGNPPALQIARTLLQGRDPASGPFSVLLALPHEFGAQLLEQRRVAGLVVEIA